MTGPAIIVDQRTVDIAKAGADRRTHRLGTAWRLAAKIGANFQLIRLQIAIGEPDDLVA